MLFAENAGPQFVLLIVLGLMTTVLLWRGHSRRVRSAGRDVAAEVRREFQGLGRAGAAEVQRMESRLYDFGREVEARVETTLAVLDRLVEEAEDEITRLELLLERSRLAPVNRETLRLPDVVGTGKRPLSPQQRRMARHLAAAGYTAADIAHLTGRSVPVIAAALSDDLQADAA